ncbi:MAG TPA: hypothetical protein DDY98_08415, partial [Ruminococcaceae bacterium]|nr:hypothetical protein [Oscillospiraceae bacterium]
MKAFFRRSLSLLLVLALFCALVPSSVFASQSVEKGALKIGIISDLHYYSPENIDDMAECERVCRQTMSTTYMADAILFSGLASLKDKINKGEIDCVIIPGDLTRNGDLVSMKKLGRILENFETDTGVSVYVINGNHDINNHHAEVFQGGDFRKTNSCTTAAQFREIFKNLGYDKAVKTFTPPKGE